MLPPPPIPAASRKMESGGRKLTQLLEELGQDTVILAGGRSIIRDQALAEQIWAAALGMIEGGKDERGNSTFLKPDPKMMVLILERREGKVPTIIAEDQGRMTAADRISEIARASINQEADVLGESDREDETLPKMPEDEIED